MCIDEKEGTVNGLPIKTHSARWTWTLGIGLLSALAACDESSDQVLSPHQQALAPCTEASATVVRGQAATVENANEPKSRWPALNPCEAAEAIGGTPRRGFVEDVLSGRLVSDGSIATWFVLDLDGGTRLIGYPGGTDEQTGISVLVRPGVPLERGQEVVYFDRSLEVDPDFCAVRPQTNGLALVLEDGRLHTVYGELSSEQASDYLDAFPTLSAEDACAVSFNRARRFGDFPGSLTLPGVREPARDPRPTS